MVNLFKVNMGGKLPLVYYNYVNDEISRRDDHKDKDFGNIPGLNQEVPNPNVLNRPLAWPIRIKSSINPDIQVENVTYLFAKNNFR